MARPSDRYYYLYFDQHQILNRNLQIDMKIAQSTKEHAYNAIKTKNSFPFCWLLIFINYIRDTTQYSTFIL